MSLQVPANERVRIKDKNCIRFARCNICSRRCVLVDGNRKATPDERAGNNAADRGDCPCQGGRRRGLGRARSEERRVGKECRSRWAPEHSKKKRKGSALTEWTQNTTHDHARS